jgi:hypothetical protein
MVQNIPYDVISEFFQPGARINNSNEDTAVGSGVIDQEWLNSIDVFVQSDASGIFAVRKLTGIMSMIAGSNDIGYQIRNIQKNGPILYLQLVYTLHNVTVNDVIRQQFFVVSEWILLPRKKDLLAIELVNPSMTPDYKAQNFVDTNLWLGSFHVAPSHE